MYTRFRAWLGDLATGVVQRSVGSVPVVVVQPDVEVLGALLGRLVGACVGPFAQGGLDEALGLAVGARGVGAGVAMHEAEAAAEVLEGAGSVGGAVVGEDAADADVGRRRAASKAQKWEAQRIRWSWIP